MHMHVYIFYNTNQSWVAERIALVVDFPVKIKQDFALEGNYIPSGHQVCLL